MKKQKICATLSLFSLLAAANFAVAQTPGDDELKLINALKRLSNKEYTASCTINASGLENTESKPAFQGDLEIFFGSEGTIAAASSAQLPRVLFYQKGEKRLYNLLHDGSEIDCALFADLLHNTLLLNELYGELATTQVEVRKVEEGEKFRATLNGAAFDFRGRDVDEVVLLANVDTEGNLAGLAFRFSFSINKHGDNAESPSQITAKYVFDTAVNAKTAKAFASQAKRLLRSK